MKRIEHIGIAVADLQAAERISQVLGESPPAERIGVEGVDVSFPTGEQGGTVGQHFAGALPASTSPSAAKACIAWRFLWTTSTPRSIDYGGWDTSNQRPEGGCG